MLARLTPFLVPPTVSLFIATLLFSKQITAYLEPRNRFYLQFQTSDALAMIAAVFAIAVLVYGVGAALTPWPRVRRVYDHFLVLVLAGGVLSTIPNRAVSMWTGILWIAVSLGVGYSLASPNSKLIAYCEKLCLVASPLVPLLFIQLLVNRNWESTEHAPDYRAKSEISSPVYFFIFDGLSYEQTTQGGEFRPEFANLKALSERSVMFRNARSPSTRTEISIPSMVYQARADGDLEGEAIWAALRDQQSVFDLARSSGYNTALVGFYIPYGIVLGDQLDYSFSTSHHPKGKSFPGKVESNLIRNLRYLKDPVSVRLAKRLLPSHHSRHWHDLGLETVRLSKQVVRSSPRNTLAVFHLPLPHWPFASNPDGSYFGHQGAVTDLRGATGRDGYRRHLLYVDSLVGQFVDVLESSGKYDDALVILTSDHAGRTEAWTDEHLSSVPLIIKLPGQKHGRIVESELSNAQLGPLIQFVLRGARGVESALASLPLAGPAPQPLR